MSETTEGTTGDVAAMVATLRVGGTPERPVRHQAIVLLWALGRARHRERRLVRWSEARGVLRDLLLRFGLPESRPTPEYPFLALARTGWWELAGARTTPPPAHGSLPLTWLNGNNPAGGLAREVHRRVAEDEAERDRVVRALLDRFFAGVPTEELLAAVALDPPAEDRDGSWRPRADGTEFDEFDTLPPEAPDDDGVAEGRLLARQHYVRERDPKLRAAKIDEALARHGRVACEVCGFDFARTYGSRGAGFAECHHVVPLHASGETTTRLRDLVLLCANCHRMIHRGFPWLTPAELRALVVERATTNP